MPPDEPIGEALPRLDELRRDVDRVNGQIFTRLQERGRLVLEIARLKQSRGLDGYDPEREEAMVRSLPLSPSDPYGPAAVREIFRSIFRASVDVQDARRSGSLLVRRRDLISDSGIRVGDVLIGGGRPVIMAGPCSVESPEQMELVARAVAAVPGAKILRAGAFKPRTSPYTFQGLREEGLRMLREAADRHGLLTVTEVLDTSTLDLVASYADILQVGARNMYNTELLKAIGRLRKPVLLKRGFMATLEELLNSAEYIVSQGNSSVVLCERGVRTFERWTRNTLDISAVPLLKLETPLPVIVDVSHALGRKDILLPCARAALAAGADGLMVEIHPSPHDALSDGFQQLDLQDFASLIEGLGLGTTGTASHRAGSFIGEPDLRSEVRR